MKRYTLLSIVICCTICALALGPASITARASQSPELSAARKARDQGAVEVLQAAVVKAEQEASQTKSFESYLRLALLQDWMCEAAQAHQNEKLIKGSAEAGVAAAEMAAKLKPDSSEAHYLLGDLMGQLIPHVFGGGFRYGRRSTQETDRAIELDPRNANAYVTRAVSYFYTPGLFGGSNKKAIEMLKKAVELDPLGDSAHIWLAQVYLSIGQKEDAVREINEARRLNPERVFTKYVDDQVNAAKK